MSEHENIELNGHEKLRDEAGHGSNGLSDTSKDNDIRDAKKPIVLFWKIAIFRIVSGAVITLVILLLEHIAATYPFLKSKEHSLYAQLLTFFFQPVMQNNSGGVVIVDISNLEREERVAKFRHSYSSANPRKETVTSRRKLLSLINAIAYSGAKAIGIDVDLRPTRPEYRLQKDDTRLLNQCLRISEGNAVDNLQRPIVSRPCKVVVGVRTNGYNPLDRVSDEGSKYASLWATEAGPGSGSDPWWLPLALVDNAKEQTNENHVLNVDATEREVLPGFAAALVSNANHTLRSKAPFYCMKLKRFAPLDLKEANEDQQNKANVLSYLAYWVDYRSLGDLVAEAIPANDGENIIAHPDKIAGRIVLIGDVKEPNKEDTVELPGIADAAPGIAVHACGVKTLLAGAISQPRMEGIESDLCASALVIVGVQLLRLYCILRFGADLLEEHSAHKKLTIFVSLLLLSVSYIVALFFRVIWPGVLVVVTSLLLHRPLERYIHKFLAKQHSDVIPDYR